MANLISPRIPVTSVSQLQQSKSHGGGATAPGSPTVNASAHMKANSSAAAPTKLPTPPPQSTISWPKGFESKMFNTDSLGEQWFRGCVYGETDARKTVTAANFGTPEEVRIIMTRRKEQTRPLEGLGYKGVEVDNADLLIAAITHPESGWSDPTWVKNPNRTLVIDDLTEAVNILMDANQVIGGRPVKDQRRSYTESGKELRNCVKISFRQSQNIVMTALAKVRETMLGDERIGPDLPPSMLNMVMTELEYVFYIKKSLWRMLVTSKSESIESTDENGKTVTYSREIFAKNKLPMKYKDANILGLDQPLDLRAVWNKILNAKNAKVMAKVSR